ncbi:hypothetical protein D5086_001570 [Populus alba]|uniref:Uncharacterized protein n=3 Tax=Populus TaxID=3689 RepID=A0ACC4CZA1_POPAL|nr:hypothetical protein NC653_001919 [Populus alba x Populus x berolinensis]TKR91881.1 hypothetical protein D5086_0000218190 [Populus alba]
MQRVNNLYLSSLLSPGGSGEPSLAAYLGDFGSTFPWELFEVMCLEKCVWGAESNIQSLAPLLQGIAEGYVPGMVYVIGLGQLFLVVVSLLFDRDRVKLRLELGDENSSCFICLESNNHSSVIRKTRFDEFVLVRQAILLPVLGLPFLAVRRFLLGQKLIA